MYHKPSIFVIIPISLAILALFFIKDLGPAYLSCFDPAYNYLLNGLNLAAGQMEIGHTDHPGTPVQIFSAIILHIVYIFKNDDSIMASVLNHPETYLKAISYSLIILHAIALFFIGNKVYKRTNSINQAVFLQLSTLISLTATFSIPGLGTESFLGILGILLLIVLFDYSFSENPKNQNIYVFQFSIIVSFLITTKVSALPLLIIPLIIIKSWLNKLKYTGLSIVFTAIILIPIYTKLSHFADFIGVMFTHQGSYGQGQEGLINWPDYFSKIALAFTKEIPFTVSYMLIFSASVFSLLKFNIFRKAEATHKKLLYTILGVISIQILIVARQFSFHYLLPAYSLSILGIYTIYRMILPQLTIVENFSALKTSVSIWILVILLFIRAIVYFNFFTGLKNPAMETVSFLKQHEQKAKVILAERHKESAFVEQALYFGTTYSGSLKNRYRSFLKIKYPKTFFYADDEDLYDWQRRFMKEALMMNNPEIILYLKYSNDYQQIKFKEQFLKLKIPDTLYQCTELFENKPSHEKIFLLKSDTSAIKRIMKPSLSISCNMEVIGIDSLKFSDANREYQFDKAGLRSTAKYFDGNYSIKLGKDSPYGCDICLPAFSGNFFRIQIWRYKTGTGGLIVAASKDNSFYRCDESLISRKKNGWELIELSFYIPKFYSEKSINIYLWNNTTKEVYFDDLVIEIYK